MSDIIRDLCSAFAPTGEDGYVRKLMSEAFESLGLEVVHDGLGSTISYKRGDLNGSEGQDRPVLLLAAPQDQRGFILVSLKEGKGYSVEFLEEIDPVKVVYQKAAVKTRTGSVVRGLLTPISSDGVLNVEGKLSGGILFVPEHPALMDELQIGDLGTLDKSHLRFISQGDVGEARSIKESLLEGAFISTGILDYVLYRVAELLKDEHLDFDIAFSTIAHSTIGYRGTKTVTDVVKPTCAIALQAFDRRAVGQRDVGHTVYYSAFDRTMLPARELMAVIESNPSCRAVVGVGSSDGSFIHKTQKGCSAISMGIAIENLSSAYERVYLQDIEDLACVLVNVIRQLSSSSICTMAHRR